ncbi:hypothetical protein KC946_01050 [Candidatus Saccharibacteria bacterium]|nr:hypothetical protein [Candidatus Saccharibacteria bacterium]
MNRNTPESRLNDEYYLHVEDRSYIPPEECQQGHVYEGHSYMIGPVGVCAYHSEDWYVVFEGLRSKGGYDSLRFDPHRDLIRGSFEPKTDLGLLPEDMNQKESLEWLLDKEIQIYQSRLEKLKLIPDRLKQANDWEQDTQSLAAWISYLLAKQRHGLALPPNFATN